MYGGIKLSKITLLIHLEGETVVNLPGVPLHFNALMFLEKKILVQLPDLPIFSLTIMFELSNAHTYLPSTCCTSIEMFLTFVGLLGNIKVLLNQLVHAWFLEIAFL